MDLNQPPLDLEIGAPSHSMAEKIQPPSVNVNPKGRDKGVRKPTM